jgi:2-polyprenyl-6-methoxyphenol hydroxylase-like FAD-dependent oxidoreductase
MNSLNRKVLVSGASIAGLSTAYWMNKIGYEVTVVEMAKQPRIDGAAFNLCGKAVDVAKRMGILDQLKSNRLNVETIEFKNADDTLAGSISLQEEGGELSDDDIEIERDKFIGVLLKELKKNVEFIFSDSIKGLDETKEGIKVTFMKSAQRDFHLVLGCDGAHSRVRNIWFGNENEYSHFLNAYFSITIVNKLLIKQGTMQMYNVPDKAVTLNAYNNKTDVIFCFFSEIEIPYDYRDIEGQRKIILEQFRDESWRTTELLEEVMDSRNFYFDKFCQIKMPSWTKGRVALVGDAAYCASPAAGMGGSLAIEGAAELADALERNKGDYNLAFQEYNQKIRPFIEEVQAKADLNIKENFIPRTEDAIRIRNAKGF